MCIINMDVIFVFSSRWQPRTVLIQHFFIVRFERYSHPKSYPGIDYYFVFKLMYRCLSLYNRLVFRFAWWMNKFKCTWFCCLHCNVQNKANCHIYIFFFESYYCPARRWLLSCLRIYAQPVANTGFNHNLTTNYLVR